MLRDNRKHKLSCRSVSQVCTQRTKNNNDKEIQLIDAHESQWNMPPPFCPLKTLTPKETSCQNKVENLTGKQMLL